MRCARNSRGLEHRRRGDKGARGAASRLKGGGNEVCGMDSPMGLRGRQPFTEKGTRLRVQASCGAPEYLQEPRSQAEVWPRQCRRQHARPRSGAMSKF
jgi:hypothetical protein